MGTNVLCNLTLLSINEYLPSNINADEFTISMHHTDSSNVDKLLDTKLQKHNLLWRNPQVYIKSDSSELRHNLTTLIP